MSCAVHTPHLRTLDAPARMGYPQSLSQCDAFLDTRLGESAFRENS